MVGHASHGGNDNDEIVARVFYLTNSASRPLDVGRRSETGSTIFLDDQGHEDRTNSTEDLVNRSSEGNPKRSNQSWNVIRL